MKYFFEKLDGDLNELCEIRDNIEKFSENWSYIWHSICNIISGISCDNSTNLFDHGELVSNTTLKLICEKHFTFCEELFFDNFGKRLVDINNFPKCYVIVDFGTAHLKKYILSLVKNKPLHTFFINIVVRLERLFNVLQLFYDSNFNSVRDFINNQLVNDYKIQEIKFENLPDEFLRCKFESAKYMSKNGKETYLEDYI